MTDKPIRTTINIVSFPENPSGNVKPYVPSRVSPYDDSDVEIEFIDNQNTYLKATARINYADMIVRRFFIWEYPERTSITWPSILANDGTWRDVVKAKRELKEKIESQIIEAYEIAKVYREEEEPEKQTVLVRVDNRGNYYIA